MELVEGKAVSSIEEIIEQIKEETSKSRLIFRGQKCYKWPLETSIERACKSFNLNLSQKGMDLEGILLREFQRRFHHYQSYIPTDDLEFLAYMQHFGAPTRLLDWTYSLHIAVYFAIEDATDEPCAVWAIDQRWLQKEGWNLLKNNPICPTKVEEKEKLERFITSIHKEGDTKHIWELIRNPASPKFVFNANPYRLHERLTIQKGLFLSPANVNTTFEDNLMALPNFQNYVKKFTIAPPCRLEILRQLDLLNVNNATLFPGLDGFARSLGVFHHRLSELQ